MRVTPTSTPKSSRQTLKLFGIKLAMSIKTDIEAYTGDIDSPDITAQARQ